MKKFFLLTVALLISVSAFAGTASPDSLDLENHLNEYYNSLENDIPTAFKVYTTPYPSLFYKLDTRSGEVWGLELRGINWQQSRVTRVCKPLCPKEQRYIGRFRLIPSRESSAHILYDTGNGRVWLVDNDSRLLAFEWTFSIREITGGDDSEEL